MFAKFKLIFPVASRIFDLESRSETSVKVELAIFALVFMKFRKFRNHCQENKKLHLHKTQMFLLFKSFSILRASSIGEKLFLKNGSMETT